MLVTLELTARIIVMRQSPVLVMGSVYLLADVSVTLATLVIGASIPVIQRVTVTAMDFVA